MLKNAPSKISSRADQQLSQLIMLKKLERPEAQFWNSFEQEYRSRLLSSMVQVQPLRQRFAKACLIAARKTAPPLAAASAIALTVVTVNNFSYLTKDASEASHIEANPTATNNLPTANDPFFIVEEKPPTVKEPQAKEISGTIYHMNVLEHGYNSNTNYRLDATPVTYTFDLAKPSLESRIIRVQPEL